MPESGISATLFNFVWYFIYNIIADYVGVGKLVHFTMYMYTHVP